jgi:HEAT repeat protein
MTMLKTNRQHLLAAWAALLIVSASPNLAAQKTPSQSTVQASTNPPTAAPLGAKSDPASDLGNAFATDDKLDSQGRAAESPVLAEKLRFSLSGYEYFPTRADLDRIGSPSRVIDELIRIATSTDKRPSLRVRAIDALGYYNEPESTEFLATQIHSPSPKSTRATRSIRHHSILSFAKATGENGLETLKPLIHHNDLQIRLTAISAIGKHGGTSGQSILKSLHGPTLHPAVVHELRKHGISE